MIRSKICSCRIVSSKANARNATRRTNTATRAKPAARPTRQPICSIRIQRFRVQRLSAAPQRTIFSSYPTRAANNFYANGCKVWRNPKQPIKCTNGSVKATSTSSRIGIFRAMRRISALKFRTHRANISTSGSTRRWATTPVSKICAQKKDWISMSGPSPTPPPSNTTSSAKTSCISTPYSGQPH